MQFVYFFFIRDWKFCTFLSIFFEFLEITFKHWLPNFRECWWDSVNSSYKKLINITQAYLGCLDLQWFRNLCRTLIYSKIPNEGLY